MAGRKKGQEDDRYLWPEFERLIGDIRPDFVIGENVPGIIKSASDTVCKDLECEGYSVRIFNFEAATVGAWHRRDRIFFVAHRNDLTLMEDTRRTLRQGTILRGEVEDEGRERDANFSERSGEARAVPVSDSHSIRCNMRRPEGEGVYRKESTCNEADSSSSITNRRLGRGLESGVGELVDGSACQLDGAGGLVFDENYINLHYWESVPEPRERVKRDVPNRASQLRALGNAVVPQQIYPIFKAIIDVSKQLDNN